MLGRKQLEHVLQRLGLMPEGATLPQAFPEVGGPLGRWEGPLPSVPGHGSLHGAAAAPVPLSCTKPLLSPAAPFHPPPTPAM